MALPSFSSMELQLLICVIGVVIFLGSFLAILVAGNLRIGSWAASLRRWPLVRGEDSSCAPSRRCTSNRAPSLALAEPGVK